MWNKTCHQPFAWCWEGRGSEKGQRAWLVLSVVIMLLSVFSPLQYLLLFHWLLLTVGWEGHPQNAHSIRHDGILTQLITNSTHIKHSMNENNQWQIMIIHNTLESLSRQLSHTQTMPMLAAVFVEVDVAMFW